MPQHKKKPDYDANKIMQELLDVVSGEYLSPSSPCYNSINRTGKEFGITLLKTRKLLITVGAYSSDTSEMVNDLYKSGKSIPDIQNITNLSRASVHSYLPYSKMVYNAKELSVNAERIRLYRDRQMAVKQLQDAISGSVSSEGIEELLWNAVERFEGYPFQEDNTLQFSYRVRGDKMIINRNEKSIERSSVNLALHIVLERQGDSSVSRQLRESVENCLYSIFCRFGIICPEKG